MTAERKDQHIELALAQQPGIGANDFDAVRFVHHALAGGDVAAVDLRTSFAGIHWPVPLYINGMTGGSARAGEVNRGLAIAARETGVPIASGSMSAYFKDPSQADTYRVLRRENPDGFVLANINAETSVEQARRGIELLEADALQIHINAVQETAMPEGDRAFSHWPERIADLVAGAGVPVVVKEVGFGLSRRTLERLRDLGVPAADVAGRGGTDFARIENDRRRLGEFAYLSGWGQSAPACLLEASGLEGIDVLGSGGVRHPLDVARALALGAAAVGVSGRFLAVLVQEGTDALIAEIRRWQEQLTQLMALLGAVDVASLRRTDVLITGELAEYCRLRGIDVTGIARRGEA